LSKLSISNLVVTGASRQPDRDAHVLERSSRSSSAVRARIHRSFRSGYAQTVPRAGAIGQPLLSGTSVHCRSHNPAVRMAGSTWCSSSAVASSRARPTPAAPLKSPSASPKL
jgi:hypothetical protein